MRSNWLLRLSLSLMCVLVGLPAATVLAQTTQPSQAQRYSRIPGVRVKAGVSSALAFQQQAFSTNGPTITNTGDTTSIGKTMLVASLNVFFDMLNSLIAALQAAIVTPTGPILATVDTTAVTGITTTTATSGGSVVTDGGATVTARGVCWNTTVNPTIADSHTTDGSGTGSFTSSLTGLTPGTTYFVAAYATNSVGTSYGFDATFTTTTTTTVTLPTVTTVAPTNVTGTTATSGGNVSSDGGGTVTARGVCWSVAPNPTVGDAHTTDGSGTGAFTSLITVLSPSTPYHVRAYATNSAGTAYGDDQVFTTQLTGG